MVRTNSEGLSAAELVARRKLERQKSADAATVRRSRYRHNVSLAAVRGQADRNRAQAQRNARSAAFEKIRADASKLLRKSFLVRGEAEKKYSLQVAALRRRQAAAKAGRVAYPRASAPPQYKPPKSLIQGPSYRVKHYTAEEIRRLTRLGEWNSHMQDQKVLVDYGKGGNVTGIEKFLADSAKATARERLQRAAAVRAATERYTAHIQAISAKYKVLVAKINAALKAGNAKLARQLYEKKDFQQTAGEFARLFGNGKATGTVRKYFADYNHVSTSINQFYASQLSSSLTASRRAEQVRNARYGENIRGGIDYNDKNNPYLKQGYDVHRARDGGMERVKRTVDQEIDHREREQRLEMERLRADFNSQDRGRGAWNQGVGKAEHLYRTGDGRTVDLDPVKQASRRTLQAFGGDQDLADIVKAFKGPRDLQAFIDGAMAKWRQDNRATWFGSGSSVNGVGRSQLQQSASFEAAFARKQAELYALFGATTPSGLDRFFQLPGISHVTAGLAAGAGAIISGGRVVLKASTGSSQVDLGFSEDELPAEIRRQMQQVAIDTSKAQIEKGGLAINAGDVGAARQQILTAWLASPAGKAFVLDRQAKLGKKVSEEDRRFLDEFYQGSFGASNPEGRDLGRAVQALVDYGGDPTSSSFVNLLVNIVADPTNAIPLKFTTYLGRAAYAAEKSAGYANPLSRVIKGYRDFIQVTEAELRLGTFGKSLKKELELAGKSLPELTLRSEEALKGLTKNAEKDAAVLRVFEELGIDSRKVDVRQFATVIEDAIESKLAHAGIEWETQGQKLKDDIAAQEAEQVALETERQARIAEHATREAERVSAVKTEAGVARTKLARSREAVTTQLQHRAKISQPEAPKPGRSAAGTGQPAAGPLHPTVANARKPGDSTLRVPKIKDGPVTAADIEVRSFGHDVSPVAQKNLLTIAERAEKSPEGLYHPKLQWHHEGGISFVQGSSVLASDEGKALLERSKSADVGEARAAYDELALRARVERMRAIAAAEDAGRFTADPATVGERGGVSGEVDAAQLLSQRRTIAYLKRASKRKNKPTGFLNDSSIVEGSPTHGGTAPGIGQYERIDSSTGDWVEDAELPDKVRYYVGSEISEIAGATPNLVRDLYESFSERTASRLGGAVLTKVRDPKWRKGLTETRFWKFLSPDGEDGLIGIDAFRFQGQAVFELFHRLRLSGNLKKIKTMTGWAELIVEADPENVLAHMWLVMTERAGLDIAGDYRVLEAGFMHAAGAASLVPAHALAMIPSGFNAGRLPLRFGFGPKLAGIAESTSDRFLAAGARWNDTVARDAVTDIFSGRVANVSQLPSQVLHFATQKYGDLWPRSALVQRYGDEFASLIRGGLRTPARLDALATSLARFDRRDGGRSIRDMLAAPNRLTRGTSKALAFHADLHAILDEAYWAGAVTHANPAAHTLALLLRLQMKPDRWISAVDRYVIHMAHAGAVVEAKAIVGDIFSSRIAQLSSRAWHEVYGGLKSGAETAVDEATGERVLVGLTPEWRLWNDLGFLSSPEEIEKAAVARKTASAIDDGLDPNDPFLAAERDVEGTPAANLQSEASISEFAQQFDEALDRFDLQQRGLAVASPSAASDLAYKIDRLISETVPTQVALAADDFAELDRLITRLRELPEGEALISAARDRIGNELLASRVFAAADLPPAVPVKGAPVVEPEPPVANLGSQTPANAASLELLRRITGMTEQEWWDFERQRAYKVLRDKTASLDRKRQARQRVRDVTLAEYSAAIEKDHGATISHRDRVAHKERVVHDVGAEAVALISPATVSPFVTGGAGAIVEQVRSLHRTLQSSTQDATSRVHALGEVSDVYKLKSAAIDAHMAKFAVPAAFWERFGSVPADLRRQITLMDLLTNWDEFAEVVSRGQVGFLDELKAQLDFAAEKQLRAVSGKADYKLSEYLEDRIVHRGDHYDPSLYEHHDRAMAGAISEARGFKRDTLTDTRRLGSKTGGPELAERELKVVLAKARMARELGVDVHAYNEMRKVARKAMVRKWTSSSIARKARLKAARLGTEYEAEFLKIRGYLAEREARKHLGNLAYGEMYGQPAREVLGEMERRYGPDAHIRSYEPKLTAYQRKSLEESIKYWSGVADIKDSAAMSRYLTSEGSVPARAFQSRSELSAFLTRVGAWNKRTADQFELGAKSWSVQEEAKFWESSYAFVPEWADEAYMRGDGNVMFHDTPAYYDQQRRWGIFNKQADVAEATSEDFIRGNASKGIKPARDLASRRKYVIERYGDLVWDGEKMISMPWLMTKGEVRDYFATQTARSMTSGLLRSTDELDGMVAAVEAALEKNDRFETWASGKGTIESADIMEFGSDILQELIQHPSWVGRKRDFVGHGLSAVASFNRALVFTNIGFFTTNVVDAALVKGPWARLTNRRLVTNGAKMSPAAAALTMKDIGEEGRTSLYRRGEVGEFSLAGALEGVGAAEGGMAKVVATATSSYRGASGVLPHMAGKVESAVKLNLARSMYDEVYSRLLAQLGDEGLARAAALEFIQKEINRFWPHAGDGPLERLWSTLVPFGQYQLRNRLFFLSEAVAHPAVLNYIEHVGAFIETENRKQWEKSHPGEVLPPYLARRIELPWTRQADGSVSFLDLSIFSDATRGLSPFFKAENPQTYRDFFAQWIRVVGPSQQAGITMVTNALGWTKRTVYVPILDEAGFPTGRYRTETLPLNEPWSQNAPTIGSIFGSSFFGVATLLDAFTKTELTGADLTRTIAKVALFSDLGIYDPLQGIQMWYFELKAKNPAAAEEWLKSTVEGAKLLDKWRNNAENPEPFMNPFLQGQVEARDKNPWFHSQSPVFQANVKAGNAELSRIHQFYDDLLFTLIPGTPAFRQAKRNLYLNTLAVYSKNPDLLKANVWGKTSAEWAATLDGWATDKLVDTFFAMNDAKPLRTDFKNSADYATAVTAWMRKKAAYLLEFPQVGAALHSAKNSVEQLWTTTEDEWAETLDRLTVRGFQIDAEKERAAATHDYSKLDSLYLQQELDGANLEKDSVGFQFSPDQLKDLGSGITSPREGFLATAKVLLDFTGKQILGVTPAEKRKHEADQRYVDGMKSIIARSKASGTFDPATFVALLKQSPTLLAAYFAKHPGKREQWATTDAYIKAISRYGQLAAAGRFSEARSYFDGLPDWVKDRYYQKHPEKRARAQQNVAYIGAMGSWVKFLQAKNYAGAKKFFDALPKWMRDRYYAKHPDALRHQQYQAQSALLGLYFAADDANRPAFLEAHPAFATWLTTHGVSGEQQRRQAITAGYQALKDPWLKRIYREKYPEVFSVEALGDRKLASAARTLAAHPELDPLFERFLKVILDTFAENAKHTKVAPRPLKNEHDAAKARKKRKGRSARWVRLHQVPA